jgi:hypothetical protein
MQASESSEAKSHFLSAFNAPHVLIPLDPAPFKANFYCNSQRDSRVIAKKEA